MATEKKVLRVYIGKEIDSDLDSLYEIWRRKQVSRQVPGIASKSKFVEWILKRYVISEGIRIVEEKRRLELESKNAV